MSLKILIFDENPCMRNCIAIALSLESSFEIVGSYGHMHNWVRHISECEPAVVIMGIKGISCVSRIMTIKELFPYVDVIIQTDIDDDELIMASVCAGASGYLLNHNLTELIDGVKALQQGGSPMSPTITKKMLNIVKNRLHNKNEGQPDYDLTLREKEVLKCIVKGFSHKMTAHKLYISYETVRSHTKKIYKKLSVGSLSEVVALAIHERIV